MSSAPNKTPNLLAASGAIPVADGFYAITKTSAGAFTLALPSVDGLTLVILDETGHAHTIVCGGSPPSGLNAAVGTLTFNGTAGSSVTLVSRNGRWWNTVLNGVTAS